MWSTCGWISTITEGSDSLAALVVVSVPSSFFPEEDATGTSQWKEASYDVRESQVNQRQQVG